ncbi:unnamed protein product [Acanthoscelides obtectus]|uniref:Uncharacterized protein n=1 Tax=Acanthoscelides obtectus TaxID=200917 RepID=A0A9P0PWJ0_ACAOB|nr:unnamed protein product [Acanthoscelides obtectus]CAK1663553.1 hypothetical protein AOBTE_LOCUS23727 [Acanthoscelides obtectus]
MELSLQARYRWQGGPRSVRGKGGPQRFTPPLPLAPVISLGRPAEPTATITVVPVLLIPQRWFHYNRLPQHCYPGSSYPVSSRTSGPVPQRRSPGPEPGTI